MSLPQRDDRLHTYGEYLRWPDEQRYELIDGVAYAMTPAPARRHQDFVLEIARQIADALEESDCNLYIAPFDVRLPEGDEADELVTTVVQPDISIICDPEKLDDRGCRGAPDWIIEILSPATAAHDQIRKRLVYEKHGVREYWLVHPTDRIVTIYTLSDDGYGKPVVAELEGETASLILPEVVVAWERVTRKWDGE